VTEYLYNHDENVEIPRPNLGQKILVADLDGTIADDTVRARNIDMLDKNFGREAITDETWRHYFHRCDEDTPIHNTVVTMRALKDAGWYILILTSRCSSVRSKTVQWLKERAVPYDALVMRDHTDIGRGGRTFKKQVMRGMPNLFRGMVRLVLEDRKALVNMWRSEGYTCWQVNEGTH